MDHPHTRLDQRIMNAIETGNPAPLLRIAHLRHRFEDRALPDAHFRLDRGKVQHGLGQRAVHVEQQRGGKMTAQQ